MILTIYVAISVTFSIGFVAGAWWASRSRIDSGSSPEAPFMTAQVRMSIINERQAVSSNTESPGGLLVLFGSDINCVTKSAPPVRHAR